MAAHTKRRFAEIQVGEVAESKPLTVDTNEMLAFARRYDPQYFHTDSLAARESIFGDVIASGIYTMALWRQLDHQICGDIDWICGVAWENVRFSHPVRGGDQLRARAECAGKRRSRKHADRGIVEFHYSLLNQTDQVVFTCRSINLIRA
jgi:acyl dehydratase